MKWLTLRPQLYKRKKRLFDLPKPEPPDRLAPMKWKIDPESEAADALRRLRQKLRNES
jgi:hypothetical protein